MKIEYPAHEYTIRAEDSVVILKCSRAGCAEEREISNEIKIASLVGMAKNHERERHGE